MGGDAGGPARLGDESGGCFRNRACERVAALLGKPAGPWVQTCGMANLAALLTFAGPGEHVVLEPASHILTSEAMGIDRDRRLQPSHFGRGRADGSGRGEELIATKRTVLLVLENTHTRAGGTTLSPELTEALAAAAKRHDCRVHLDGARLSTRRSRSASLRRPRRAGELRRDLVQQEPFGAVRGRARGQRGGRRAGAGDAAPPRRRELPPGRHRRGGRARRARHDGRPGRRRPPPGARARARARGDPGRDAAAGRGRDEHRARRRERHGHRARGLVRSLGARASGCWSATRAGSASSPTG